MINKKIREHIDELGCDSGEGYILFENPSFDNSIVGVTEDGSVQRGHRMKKKKKLYALLGEHRLCMSEEDVCVSVKTEFVQISYKKKELEDIAKQLNDCHYLNIHWRVEEVY